MSGPRRTVLVAAAVFALVTLPLGGHAAEPSPQYPTCVTQHTQVSLAHDRAASQRLVGRLCSIGATTGKTLQILVPGYTYDHRYWDPAFQRERYSYVLAATRAGYATYTIDRLGTGRSSHPPATATSVPTHAWALHQLVQQARTGGLTGTPARRVVVVGHSMGAAIAQVEASRFRDPDAVVLADWLHIPARGAIRVPGTSIPTQLDPKFRDAPVGYTTTLAGTRGGTFYNAPDADPAMITYDERALKSTGTVTEEVTVFPTVLPGVTRGISVPVLLAVGEYDGLFCGVLTPCHTARQVRDREEHFFSPQACLRTYVLPGAGHSINLHRNAGRFFAAATAWMSHVAPARASAPSLGCRSIGDRY